MIPGHVLEKNTRNLYTFFFPSSFNRKYVHTIACAVVFVGPAHFVFNAYPGRNATCPLPSCSNKSEGPRGRFNCISTVFCKGSVCVEVLTSFYGRFFVEEGQFIKYTPSTSSLWQRFFSFIDPASLWRADSSGSQPVYRKLFPHGPHSSKNTFFEIKISQRCDWEAPSLSYYGSCSVFSHTENFSVVRFFKHFFSTFSFKSFMLRKLQMFEL